MMDRPEWIDTFPHALTAIATLTNNNRRGTTPVPPGQPPANNPDGSTVAGTARPPVDAINPRVNNVYGHIITWKYDKDWTEPDFEWEIFVLAGNPDAVPSDGSDVDGDKFGSPDGIYVAPSGRLWIQTDVSTSTINAGAYAGFGNNQMLCADPSTGEIRRFLQGPISVKSLVCRLHQTKEQCSSESNTQARRPTNRRTIRPTRRGSAPGPTVPLADVRARPAL